MVFKFQGFKLAVGFVFEQPIQRGMLLRSFEFSGGGWGLATNVVPLKNAIVVVQWGL